MPQTEKYVCFRCRRVHRKPSGRCHARVPCHMCGGLMMFVGGDFKTPKQCDIAGWKRTEKWALKRKGDA